MVKIVKEGLVPCKVRLTDGEVEVDKFDITSYNDEILRREVADLMSVNVESIESVEVLDDIPQTIKNMINSEHLMKSDGKRYLRELNIVPGVTRIKEVDPGSRSKNDLDHFRYKVPEGYYLVFVNADQPEYFYIKGKETNSFGTQSFYLPHTNHIPLRGSSFGRLYLAYGSAFLISK